MSQKMHPGKSVARGRRPLSAEAREQERRRIGALAEALFQSEGFEAVSMRRLADIANCTPMTLYAYFENKADILHQIWSSHFEALFNELEARKSESDEPALRLVDICKVYVRYWVTHPEHYRLVFMTPGVSQNEVGSFMNGPNQREGASSGVSPADHQTSAAVERFVIFFDGLSLCRPTDDQETIRVLGETLICALHGIAHSHVTMSPYPWLEPAIQIECLVQALIQSRPILEEQTPQSP
jgi:AcrR family transcriptional regulator